MHIFGHHHVKFHDLLTSLFIYDNLHHLVDTFNDRRLTPELLEEFTQAVTDKGGACLIPGAFCMTQFVQWHDHHAINADIKWTQACALSKFRS